MTRLTDEQLAELERLHEAYMAVCLTKGDCFKEYYPLEQFVLEHYPAILAELRALRKVREAADAYRLVVARFNTSYQEDGQSSIDLDHAEAALFAALDEARGEQ